MVSDDKRRRIRPRDWLANQIGRDRNLVVRTAVGQTLHSTISRTLTTNIIHISRVEQFVRRVLRLADDHITLEADLDIVNNVPYHVEAQSTILHRRLMTLRRRTLWHLRQEAIQNSHSARHTGIWLGSTDRYGA